MQARRSRDISPFNSTCVGFRAELICRTLKNMLRTALRADTTDMALPGLSAQLGLSAMKREVRNPTCFWWALSISRAVTLSLLDKCIRWFTS